MQELDDDRDACNHCDVLVRAAHNSWKHIVTQEQRPKNHTSSNACQPTQDSSNKANNRHFDQTVQTIEFHIIWMEAVAISILDFVSMLDRPHAVDGQQEH